MKKSLIVVTTLCIVLLATGCGKSNNEKLMKKYATDYYENFMKDYVLGTDEVEISLDMLTASNKSGDSSYDLKKLEKCKKTSKVIFTLKKDSNKIDKTQYKLNCK